MAGPPSVQAAFVRPYLLPRGRTRPRHWLSPETLLETGNGRPGPGLAEAEYRRLTDLCRQRRRSVAELAGTTGLPLSTARVLISDLVDAGVLDLSLTTSHTPTGTPVGNPSTQLLEALSAGLRRKWPDADARAS
ncbi:DUF742 domain-containing protein [Streptomyces olivaceus]|uniref:DUF742 domain-containing protein n=1 Tax=Streptomyces olivaceus TaxID=47716 RepID=UPI001884F5A6|nr:DUF742 domain-containing protein [Streptomyces olivaceus]